jgi:hypothetical protein
LERQANVSAESPEKGVAQMVKEESIPPDFWGWLRLVSAQKAMYPVLHWYSEARKKL